MTLVITVLVVALVFEYINGFHDTAISIATSISTKVLTPRQAVALAALCNLTGALIGVSVATTIGKGLVEPSCLTTQTILSALLAAIVWNLFTWWLGLPSSSSHALIGGLCGAALATSNGKWEVIRWSVANPVTGKMEGIWHKVIAPMFASPAVGFAVAFALMLILLVALQKMRPRWINLIFGKLQLASAGWMGISHGMNDAQKTMGVIALVLCTATQSGTFDRLPGWLEFLRTPEFQIALWVKVTCALTMAAGTAAGGWRIIKTLGHKVVKLQPIHGFTAQTTAAAVIQLASHWGIPLSTTQVISTCIMGVGATKRLSAVKWGVVGQILWAWTLTLPVTAFLAYWIERGLLLIP